MQNVVFGDSPYSESDQLYSIAYATLASLRNTMVPRTMSLAKVMASLSCGVPMIYAGRGESAELLKNQGCGVVVPPEDPAKLAEAMAELAKHLERRKAMGMGARNLAEQEYGWDGIVKRWLAELTELMRADGWDRSRPALYQAMPATCRSFSAGR